MNKSVDQSGALLTGVQAPDGETEPFTGLHILWGGPDRWLSVGSKRVRFEDHPRCGPVLLHSKTGDPLEHQPGERDLFWTHYEAWVRGGKRVNDIGGKPWCVYETDVMVRRGMRAVSSHVSEQDKE